MNLGRWLVTLLFAAAAASQLFTGISYLLGFETPELPGVALPADQQELVVKIAGGVVILVGGVYALAAWGLFRWASWARVLAIVLCGVGLLGLVVVSFQAKLTLVIIASAIVQVALLIWFFSPRVETAFAVGGKQG